MASLIDAEYLEDRIGQLRERVKDMARWNGVPEEDVRLRAGLVFAELEDALHQAREQYKPIIEAAKRTGYHPQTLREYAQARLKGGEVPQHWATLDVRRRGRGYEVRLSTIPPNPRA